MKTKLLMLLGIVFIGIFFIIALDNLSSISSFFQTSFPAHVKNNPLSHHFMISDLQNTKEYMVFASKFPIYDEGIIHTGSVLEYKVTASNNQTDNLLILDLKYYVHNDKIHADIRCSVLGPDGIFHISPNNSYDDRVINFIEHTDCLEKTANNSLDTNLTSSIRIQTDKETYNTHDVIVISGSVDQMIPDAKMIISISNPLGNIIAISQASVVDDRFVGRFQIDGPLWEQNGIYTISVRYGEENTVKTEFLFLSDLSPDELL
ncbi:hypothetical protein [Nitrosarchaeum sp. AC2]|uniref:hypothetical protein n=1 Tax=Nitrosarchaeum sp. AC2 TaxID=2259673 RepID=UPI0015C83472|nr:hypothetical protein [Nitrosarchaeum sp. AC2]QLH10833.1 hypothetical protein DSQ20_04620 [Nitrosarchaeum sp. AC2]